MDVVWFRAWRLARARPSTAWSTGLLVAVVIGAVVFVAGGATRTLSAPERYESTFGGTFDALVEQGDGEPQGAELAALPSVAVVRSSTFLFASLVDGDGRPLESLVFAGTQDSFGTRLTEGREPADATEIAVSHAFLEQSGAKIGDRYRLVSVARATAQTSGFDVAEPDGPSFEVTIVGSFTGAIELQDSYALAVMPAGVLAQDIGIAGTQHVIGLAPGADVERLRADLDRLPGGSDFGIKSAELVPETVVDAVTARGQGTATVAVVLAFASVVALGQLLGRQHRLGDADTMALRTMGMTRRQLVADPVARSAIPVAGGLLLGSVAAYLASGWFPLGFASPVETNPGVRFEPTALLIVGPVLAAAVLTWVGLGARRALRPRAVRSHPGVAETAVSRLRPLAAATGARFAVTRSRNGAGSPFAGVAGVAVLLGLAVAATTMSASIGTVLDHPQHYALADLAIGAGGGPLSDDQIGILRDDPDLTDITLLGSTFVSVGTNALDLTGQRVERGTSPVILLDGAMPTADDEAVLGSLSADVVGVGVGDRLQIKGPAGRQTLRVTGLAVVPPAEGGDGVGEGILMTDAGLRRVDPEAGLTTASMAVRAGASIEQVGGRLADALQADVKAPDQPVAIFSMQRIRAMPYLVAGALVVLALVALAHQLLVTARQRRHELAVLRALGADRAWTARAIHWQATLTALLVAAVAALVGIALGRWVTGEYLARIGLARETFPPWATLLVAFAALVLVTNLVGIVPARRVRRHEIGVDLTGR